MSILHFFKHKCTHLFHTQPPGRTVPARLWALPLGALRGCFVACCRQKSLKSTAPQICSSSFSLPFSGFSPFPAAKDSGRVIISAFGLYFPSPPTPPAHSAKMLSGSHHPGMKSTRLFVLTFDPTRPPSEPDGWARERRTIFGYLYIRTLSGVLCSASFP